VVATVLAAILVTLAEVGSEVTLVAPPPLAMVKEEGETELPALPSGGPHGSPSRLELEVPGGDASRLEVDRLAAAYENEVVEIPSDGKAGDEVEPLALS